MTPGNLFGCTVDDLLGRAREERNFEFFFIGRFLQGCGMGGDRERTGMLGMGEWMLDFGSV